MTPPPTELRFFRTLPGRLFLLSAGLCSCSSPCGCSCRCRSSSRCSARSSRWRWSWSLVWLARPRHSPDASAVPLAGPPEADSLLRLPRLRAGAARRWRFALAASVVLYINVAAYMFREGFGESDRRRLPDSRRRRAGEIGRNPASRPDRAHAEVPEPGATQYPALSLAVLPLIADPAMRSARRARAAGSRRSVASPRGSRRGAAMAVAIEQRVLRGVVAYASPDAPDEWHAQ